MIFQKCNGSRLVGTQADARAIDKHFIQVDIPTDKAGLMAFVNDLYAEIERLKGDLNSRDFDASIAPVTILPAQEEPDIKPDIVPLGEKIDSWFEPIPEGKPSRPIDRMLADCTYTEALRINQASVERMVQALIERKHS